MKNYLIIYEDEKHVTSLRYDSESQAIMNLYKHADLYQKTGCQVTKTDADKFLIIDPNGKDSISMWLSDKEHTKVSAKTINNQSKPIYQQTKTKTVMAQSKGLKIGTTKSGKAVYGNAKVSSAYRATGTKNKKPAMVVPVGYVTLPSPFYTFGRKHQNLGKKGGFERVRTYVIGATMTKNGKKMYIVAQLTYMGGKPAVAENRYKGYSRYTAWNVFNEIPYTTKSVKDAKGKWKESKSDGTSAAAVQEAIAQRKAIAAARAKSKK